MSARIMTFEELAAEFGEQKASEIIREREAVARLKAAIGTVRGDLDWYWYWGDGQEGYVLDLLSDAVRSAGHYWPFDRAQASPPAYAKKIISRGLSKRVFERDAYRCVSCGSYIDLTCDHILAESLGGATSFDNLQTMCRPCNSRKGAKPA